MNKRFNFNALIALTSVFILATALLCGVAGILIKGNNLLFDYVSSKNTTFYQLEQLN